jgi:RHS repeat-associated protein
VASSIVYDGDGNRVSETIGGTTTKFLVDDQNPTGLPQVMDELVNGSVTRTYAYGGQRISQNQLMNGTWTPSFYGYDAHGSVRFLSNTAASITDSYDFDAFGMPIRTNGTMANMFRYSGEWSDNNLTLYHLRDRYYNQTTGRFETSDPYEGDVDHPASLHRYVFTGDDPVDFVDPTGDEVLADYVNLSSYAAGRTVAVGLRIEQCLNSAFSSEGLAFGYAVNSALQGYSANIVVPGQFIAGNFFGVCYVTAVRNGLFRPPLKYLFPNLPSPWRLLPSPPIYPPWFPFPVPKPKPVPVGPYPPWSWLPPWLPPWLPIPRPVPFPGR